MRRGLVVGKFMPLHRGHQLLIESALAQVDDLTIVVYDSDPDGSYPSMPIEKRIGWISELYPSVENIVPRKDILAESYLTQDDKDNPKYAQDYANDIDFLGKFDIVFTSEKYGEPFAKALGAESVVVDVARSMLPVSGTQIRENVYENRGWVDPVVYRSLIQKIVFVGTESTGKSTLAERMAKELDTLWTHEYGRELWQKQNLTGTFADHLKIATNQYRREQAAALHSRDYLFCDTNAWTTLQWSLAAFGTADARLYDLVERTKDEYIWILCENDFGWVDDGQRELKGTLSRQFHDQQVTNLYDLGVPFVSVAGPIDYRVDQVKYELGLTK